MVVMVDIGHAKMRVDVSRKNPMNEKLHWMAGWAQEGIL